MTFISFELGGQVSVDGFFTVAAAEAFKSELLSQGGSVLEEWVS